MEKRINWLHFTDLHYGLKGQNILLPKIKNELFKDIEFIKKELGKIDVVFFTGDLTQSGKQEEFEQLTVFLKELWRHFNKLNSDPFLIAIPGNHDLERPDLSRAVVKALRNYSNDIDLQNTLWSDFTDPQNEYFQIVEACFRNFNRWYQGIDLPKPDLRNGLVPGDIFAEICINGVSLKVIGLNTAFLEISGDDYLKKLALNPAQIMTLVGNNPPQSIGDADLSLLLTHHDPKWYDSSSLAYYDNDINPPGTFYAHLCGHLHQADAFIYGKVGAEPRRIQLGPSLFGLQKIDNKIDRIHGYYAGSYFVQDDNIKELFYPRKANLRYDGNYGIDQDTGFHLGKSGYIKIDTPRKINEIEENPIPLASADPTPDDRAMVLSDNILDLSTNNSSLLELDKTPRIQYLPSQQHTQIRLVEQHAFVEIMKTNRLCWLITDWGLNETEFIGSLTERLQLDKTKGSFILNCEDIASDKELLTAVNEQFGMTLQRFCNLAAAVDDVLLVFDHVNVTLFSNGQSYGRFNEILTSILDYCIGLKIVVVARQAPTTLKPDDYVRLSPFDYAQMKSYIEHHPGSTIDLKNSERLRKLLEITSGLPKHIDRIIDSLKVVTFEEIVEAERESLGEIIEPTQIPKSLRQAISLLTDTTDRMRLRSLKLLKILTVLANGETYSNLHHFDSSEPIYTDNAAELEKLSLLEVITTSKMFTTVSGSSIQQIKILRVPRQIRDYVNTIITDNERDNIVKQSCDMYFGAKWRQGSIKDVVGQSLFGPTKFINVDNCHLIINNMMAMAVKNESENEIDRASLLALNFCEHVSAVGDYKNVINTGEDIYNWLKPTEHEQRKAQIAKLLGEALRMAGSYERSTTILLEALNMEKGQFSNADKHSILTDLGYIYLAQEINDKAIEIAKTMEKTAPAKGVWGLQAKFILASATLEGEALIKRLKVLETEARKLELTTLAHTISLDIVELSDDSNDQLKRLDKILKSEEDEYNKVRAVVKKSTEILNTGDALSMEDLLLLNKSYSYLYTQQLGGLFKRCHKALWTYCVQQKKEEDLLNLYKHSSLVWRITGDLELEKSYFQKLNNVISGHIDNIPKSAINSVNIDYFKRRKIELIMLSLTS